MDRNEKIVIALSGALVVGQIALVATVNYRANRLKNMLQKKADKIQPAAVTANTPDN